MFPAFVFKLIIGCLIIFLQNKVKRNVFTIREGHLRKLRIFFPPNRKTKNTRLPRRIFLTHTIC